MRRGILALGLVLAMAACEGNGKVALDDGAGQPDTPVADPGTGELPDLADPGCERCDLAEEDGIPADPGGELPPGDTLPDGDAPLDAEADSAADCHGFGCACSDNADCLSGFCTMTRDGSVCSKLCGLGIDCPPGWGCEQISSVGDEPVFGCIDRHANLCRPCRTAADCQILGGGNRRFLCLEQGPEGSFCGSGCEVAGDCPDGYDCVDATSGRVSAKQCRPAEGEPCPCTDRYRDEGALTVCRVTVGDWTCTAERTCDAPCTAATPVAETCDGADNDCDGATDQGLDGQACTIVNAYGECPGTSRCVGGKPLCEGTAAAPEVCGNGLDEDCDREVDEEGAAGCTNFLKDEDRDRYGVDGDSKCLCQGEAPYDVTTGGDCDDGDGAVKPTATERCNGVDDDCDGTTDEDTLAECFPTVCSTAQKGCLASCTGPEDCQAPWTCDDGVCRKVPGQPCGGDDECVRGLCVDGVCCDSRCDGTCERCDLAQTKGTCTPLPVGTDPDAECAAADPATCGTTGECSGLSACTLWPAGTVCAPSACDAATVAHASSTCDGLGACLDRGTIDCAPFTCDAATGLCRQSCFFDRDCGPGFACADGYCLRDEGQGCSADAECASGFCTDGVCCGSRCDGTCEVCDLEGAVGECLAVPEGQDPGDECEASGAEGCGLTGTCSGFRSCSLWAVGSTCHPAECLDAGTSANTDECDGKGACIDGGTTACHPYVCDTTTGTCLTACVQDDQCQAGTRCSQGACRKVEGASCADGMECATLLCVDGRCCDRACDGLCEACDLGGSEGTCTWMPDQTDPDAECPNREASTCGTEGTCDGQGGCRLFGQGTPCSVRACASLYASYPVDACDGAGACIDAGIVQCLPYLCDPVTGGCRTTCGTSADCQAGYACAGTACLKADGQPCGADAECARGFCTDGVCCDARCHGLCESCALAGQEGRCAAVPSGEDPDGECANSGALSCGTTGACSGLRSCALAPDGKVCAAGYCVDDATMALAALCDGLGTCLAARTVPCGSYGCDAGTGACRTTCAIDDDCTTGYVCVGTTCKKDEGQPCASGTECASGECWDGTCCGTRCSGTCESCNQAGREGFCDPVPAGTDPAGECPADAIKTCGRTGECSGQRSCALLPEGTGCAAAVCASSVSSDPADACDGNGTCVDSPNVDCQPYTCDAATGACRTTCTGSGDCTTNRTCVGGACLLSTGQGCSTGTECATGFCVDGVCCESACDGICARCNLPGTAGFCEPVPAGSDYDNECTDQPTSTCGRTGMCSGASACALYPVGTTCAPATCLGTGTSILADLCDGGGSCLDAGTKTCAPYVCSPATGLCLAACGANADCAADHECVGTACLRSAGVACSADTECASGFCTDGVCCRARCGGTCEACDLAGRAGWCDPVPAGQDLDNECPVDGVSSCDRTGACSGSRSCALYDAGTTCQAASCTGNTSYLADTCDGAGTCSDGGSQACIGYACNPATGLCRTTCSQPSDCQTGYSCIGGTCRKDAGQACTSGAECATGACCSNVCRDLTSDADNCGACGTVCQQVNGTNACVGSVCTPNCNTGYGTCDGNVNNGCEQSLDTLAHCGACSTSCARDHAAESCATRTCVLGACDSGWANCDGNAVNGCEASLSTYANACGSATNLGSKCGDMTSGFLCPSTSWSTLATRNGRGGYWYSATIEECSGCCTDLHARVTLTVPAGVNYDLYVYQPCGTLMAHSTNGEGATDQVTVTGNDDCLLDNDSFTIQIEVRFVSGSSCENWTLAVAGTTAT